MTTKKLVIKQIILLVIALSACLFLGSIDADSVFGNYIFEIETMYQALFYLFFVILIIFYAPLAFLFILHIRQGEKTDNLHKFFRIANWFVIILLFALFFMCLYWLFRTRYYIGEEFLWRGDPLYYLKGLLSSVPFLAVASLFFWTNKVNKSLASEIKDKKHFGMRPAHYPTKKELEQKMWYRILKVLSIIFYIIFYIVILFEFGVFKEVELDVIIVGSMLLFLTSILFYILIILLLEEAIFYIIYGKEKTKSQDS
jgi:hypothetical protein